MPSAAILASALLFAGGPASDAPAAGGGAGIGAASPCLHVYPFAMQHEWREYDPLGVRLLKESGPLPGAGARLLWPLDERSDAEARLSVFGGEVAYDGAKLDFSPYETKTFYFGGDANAGVVMRLPVSERVVAGPLAGLGARCWIRRLDHTDEREFGYDEVWLTSRAAVGVEARARLAADRAALLRLEYRLPLASSEYAHIELSDEDATTPRFEPGGRNVWFVEASIEAGDCRFAAFYEQLRFGASDVEPTGFYQPQAEGELIGVSWGVKLW